MRIHSIVAGVLILSPFAGSASASCYPLHAKLHFTREKDPITREDVLGTTVIGAVAGGVILGLTGGVMATWGGRFRDGFATGAVIGGAVTAFNAWQAVSRDRQLQQRRLRDAMFYYLSHPDFADANTTADEHAYVSDLVQSFRAGIQARLDARGVSYDSLRLSEDITASAQKLDLEREGCRFKRGARVVHSIEKLQRLVVRDLAKRAQPVIE